MKLLVTGASGFIGSNLVERLLKDGHKIVGIDNDYTKRHLLNKVIPKNEKMYIMQANRISDNFSMIWDDINNISKYYFALDGIDEVYHLAASADIRASYQDPTLDLKNNVQGTNVILELMRKKDIKKLIFSSSSAIYGITKETPTPENIPDIRPISMYGASKLANEAFIHAYSDLYNIKSWMFRFANVVGNHQHRGVVHDFIHKLKSNKEELEILGDGKQEKSYFDVSDCVSGLVDIPRKDNNNSVGIYNLGNTEIMNVRDLAKIVCDKLKASPMFKFTGGDRGWPGDVPSTILSIDKALAVGWKPKYSCEESIERAVDWFVRN